MHVSIEKIFLFGQDFEFKFTPWKIHSTYGLEFAGTGQLQHLLLLLPSFSGFAPLATLTALTALLGLAILAGLSGLSAPTTELQFTRASHF